MKDRKYTCKIESYLGKTHGWFEWFGLSVGVPRLSPGVQGWAPEADSVGGAGHRLQLQQAVVSVQADREAPHGVQWAVLGNYLQGAWEQTKWGSLTIIRSLSNTDPSETFLDDLIGSLDLRTQCQYQFWPRGSPGGTWRISIHPENPKLSWWFISE